MQPVNNIYLDDATYFTIASTDPSPTPFVLHPGDRLTTVITYIATDQLVHHAHLMIDADHQLQSTSFDLQGVQLAAASVSNSLPQGVTISLSPNPAKDYLTVGLTEVKTADIQITDLLGKTITTAKANASWKWDASDLANGTYIVRISGESTRGEAFTIAKKIVMNK